MRRTPAQRSIGSCLGFGDRAHTVVTLRIEEHFHEFAGSRTAEERRKSYSVRRTASLHHSAGLSLAGCAVGGIKLTSDPGGNPGGVMPQSLLQHSPFDSYFIPGTVLLLANGILPLLVLWHLLSQKNAAWVVGGLTRICPNGMANRGGRDDS